MFPWQLWQCISAVHPAPEPNPSPRAGISFPRPDDSGSTPTDSRRYPVSCRSADPLPRRDTHAPRWSRRGCSRSWELPALPRHDISRTRPVADRRSRSDKARGIESPGRQRVAVKRFVVRRMPFRRAAAEYSGDNRVPGGHSKPSLRRSGARLRSRGVASPAIHLIRHRQHHVIGRVIGWAVPRNQPHQRIRILPMASS